MSPTLTANEVAFLTGALAHMQGFYKKLPASKFRNDEMAKAKALTSKFSALLDERCPATYNQLVGVDWGQDDGETILFHAAPEKPHA